MYWEDFRKAFEEAKRTMAQADEASTDMARMLVGRLRKVNSSIALKALKAELKDFDMRTERWKEPK